MEVRIYYDDTDAGGVVYHANYLRYLERGRTEFLRDRGLSVQAMHEAGIIFPVVAIEINYRAPARWSPRWNRSRATTAPNPRSGSARPSPRRASPTGRRS